MEAQIKLGRIFGIEIGLHYSWVLIALLITLSLSGYFSMAHPGWSQNVIWGMSLSAALMFFAAIIAHELSHALVARARGLTVRRITLFALGGVAQLENEPEDAKTEFWMSIAGPITSALIGFICLALAGFMGWSLLEEPARPSLAVLVWLGYINLGLALFNMLPGFPMDGGRVLRAAIWWFTGNARKSMRIATLAGQAVAFGFIVLGIFRFFNGAGFGGLWMAFIGWFLLTAARAADSRQETMTVLRDVRVTDLMSRQCATVDGHLNLQNFVNDYLLRTANRCFLILENEAVVGLITPHEIKTVEQQRWPYTTIYEVMRPLEQLRTVAPESSVADALEIIERENLNQLPVVSGNQFVGMISRELILNYLFTRAELHLWASPTRERHA